MSGENESRQQGIEFGELDTQLDEEAYPLERETLLDRYGERELELPDGTIRLADVLDIADSDQFSDADEVRQTVVNFIGDEAIGREGYTDRGAQSPTEEEENDQESL